MAIIDNRACNGQAKTVVRSQGFTAVGQRLIPGPSARYQPEEDLIGLRPGSIIVGPIIMGSKRGSIRSS